MKTPNKKNLLVAITMFLAGTVIAQDIHFSQFYETPLYRNPALAGIVTGDVRVQMVYRTQWNSVSNAYKTGSVNAEYKVPVGNGNDFLTMGALVFYDRAGTVNLTTTHVMPALNFHKSISNDRNVYVSAGFMAGWVQRRFDRSKMTTNSQYDGLGDGETFDATQYSYLDGSAGVSFNAGISQNPEDNMYLGIAYSHFNKPKNSFYANEQVILNPKMLFSGGVRFGVSESSYLTIEADHSRQGTYRETVGGIMFGKKLGDNFEKPDYAVQAGMFLRWNDALIPTMKIDYKPYAFALSYDVNISKLKPSSYGRGGFELSFTYIGFLDRDNSSLNAVRCPRF